MECLTDSCGDGFTFLVGWLDDISTEHIVGRLSSSGVFKDDVLVRVVELVEEFVERLDHVRPEGLCGVVDGFVADHGEGWQGVCDRRAVIGLLRVLSRVSCGEPGWPPGSSVGLRRRVLSPVEAGLVRYCAVSSVVRAATVGALESGVVSGELGLLTRKDVVFNSVGQPVALVLPGTFRRGGCGYPVAVPRQVELVEWCRPYFQKVCDASVGGGLLLYHGMSTQPPKIQSAVLMGVTAVLQNAGLGSDRSVKPLSIRNTAGRERFDREGGLETIALWFGHTDLMSVAREIGVRPHKPTRKTRLSK